MRTLHDFAYDLRFALRTMRKSVVATATIVLCLGFSVGATTYQVNALGQRVRKSNSAADTVFHYDTRGKLIAESDPGGGLKRELIYLGDVPAMVFQ